MPTAYSFDGLILAPYAMQDVEEFWNKWFSKRFNFRSYTHRKSNSVPKAAYRFSRILRDSAAWLDGSSKTDIDVLFDTWRAKMLAISVYLEQNGVSEAEDLMNRPVNAMVTFWTFHANGCRHIHHLSCLQLGIDPDGSLKTDEDRRKGKAELLRLFTGDLKVFAKQAAYLSSSDSDSNRRLEQVLEIARTSLEGVLDDLRWKAGGDA